MIPGTTNPTRLSRLGWRRCRGLLAPLLAFGVLASCGSSHSGESTASRGSASSPASTAGAPVASTAGTVFKNVIARPFQRDCPYTDRSLWGYEIVVNGVSWVHSAYRVLADDVVLDPAGQTEYLGELEVVTDGQLGRLLDTKGPNGEVQVWDGSEALFRTAGLEVKFYSSSLGPCGLMDP